MPQPLLLGLWSSRSFSARGSGIVLRVSMGRGAPFSEMNRLFQLAYEGFQAAEGEVGRWPSCRWGLGQAGGLARWGILGSLCRLCVFCTAAHCGWGEAGPCEPCHLTNPQGREEE